MSATIREFSDDDVPAIAGVLREVRPGGLWSAAAIRHWHRNRPARAAHRGWVTDEDGRVVGWASALRTTHVENADSGGLHVSVLSDRRGRGVGGELYRLALGHLRSLGLRTVSVVSVDADGHGFLERHGYRHTHTERYSRVDPGATDFSELPELRARLRAEGFAVAPFTACRPEDVHAVDAETSADIPEDEPMTYMPFEEWLRLHWDHPQVTKEGSFAVLHEGRPVTIAMLRLDEESGRAGNDITGTLRAYRGRGLARLAKLCQLEWAAARGIESVVTGNDETNAPMLALNTRLGYRPFHEERTYVRDVSS